MTRRCWPWWHLWGRWAVSYEVAIKRTQDGGCVGKLVVQERECEKCGYRQIDKQRVLI
jgi:hypothetical protein